MADTEFIDHTLNEKLIDRVWRLNHLYKIRTKLPGYEGQAITFQPNKVQKRIYQTIETQFRTIILKPRKLGCTTGIALYLLDKAMYSRNQLCRTIAHRKSTAQELFNDIAKFSYNQIPVEIRPDAKYTTRSELEFELTGSKYVIDVEARGATPTLMHLSEAAYFEDEPNLIDTIESLPATARGIAESTANGKGNWFEKTFTENWQLLQQGRIPSWYPLFFAWFDDPTNVLPCREGVEFYYGSDCAQQKLKYKNMDGSPLSEDQLLWWDRKKFELGERLPELYPSSAEEAFIFSTGRVYPDFNRALHVIRPTHYDDYEISMDYGQSNPTVFLLSHQDNDGNFIFFKEFYKRNCPIQEMRRWLEVNAKEKMDEQGYIHIRFPDPSVFMKNQVNVVQTAGTTPDHRSSIADEFTRNKIILYQGSTQNDVRAGIVRCQEYLRYDPEHYHPFRTDEFNRPVRGSPRVFFTEDMVSTIDEFSNYIWPKEQAGNLNNSEYEVPRKSNDHAQDAWRYRVFSSGQPVADLRAQSFPQGSVGQLVQRHLEAQEQKEGL